jgi:hypothetical protein
MPNIGDLVGRLIRLVVDALGESSLRLGPVPTLVILVVPLIVLSLVARPERRWASRDLGALDHVGQAMARAAESGTDAIVSLGSAGLIRATSAAERIQTLAAVAILDRVARAAARAAVPLRVTVNDPILAFLVRGTLARAHRQTETVERSARSTVDFVGDGRPIAAAAALTDARAHGLSITAGGLGEEGLLLVGGMASSSGWSVGGSASPSQLAAPLLETHGTLVGPELFQAVAEAGGAGRARTSVIAANRLILLAVAVMLLGSAAVALGAHDFAAFLVGR